MENWRSVTRKICFGVAVGFSFLGATAWGADSEVIFADSFDTGSDAVEVVNSNLAARQSGSLIEREGVTEWRETLAGNLEDQGFQINQNRLEASMLMGAPAQRGRLTVSPELDFGSEVSGKEWQLRAMIRLELVSVDEVVSLEVSPHDTDLRFIFGDTMDSIRSGTSAEWDLCVRFTFYYNSTRAQWYLRPLISLGERYVESLPDVPLQPEVIEGADGLKGFFTADEELVITVDEKGASLSVELGKMRIVDGLDISDLFQGTARYFSISAARGGDVFGMGAVRHSVDDFSIRLVD